MPWITKCNSRIYAGYNCLPHILFLEYKGGAVGCLSVIAPIS